MRKLPSPRVTSRTQTTKSFSACSLWVLLRRDSWSGVHKGEGTGYRVTVRVTQGAGVASQEQRQGSPLMWQQENGEKQGVQTMFGGGMDSTTKKLNVENERKGGIGVDFSTCGLHTTWVDMLFPRMGTSRGSSVPRQAQGPL